MSLNRNKGALLPADRCSNYWTPEYTIKNYSGDSFKYLGVRLFQNLTTTNYVNQVTSSANRVFGYIRRNLNLAPSSVKLLAYKTLAR